MRAMATDLLQRSPLSSHGKMGIAPPIVRQVLQSVGSPLNPGVRTTMETRFDRDFSSVRVHHDSVADASTSAVNALAYTVGRDIVFGASQYSPQSSAGQKLLTHELVHVMQQWNHPRSNQEPVAIAMGEPDDRFEQEANGMANAAEPGAIRSGVSAVPNAPIVSRLDRTNPYGTGPKSKSVTDLEEATVQAAEAAIQAGKFQQAINLIVHDLANSGKMNLDLLDSLTMTYDPTLPQEGNTSDPQKDREGKTLPTKVQIGKPAFAFGVQWLYSTILHEYTHVRQAQPIGTMPGIKVPKTAADPRAHAQEVEAYAGEILNAQGTGVNSDPKLILEIWNRLRSHWLQIMPVIKRSLQDLVTRAFEAAQKLVGKQTVLTAP